jgi:hypothetical protein
MPRENFIRPAYGTGGLDLDQGRCPSDRTVPVRRNAPANWLRRPFFGRQSASRHLIIRVIDLDQSKHIAIRVAYQRQ